MKILLLLAGCVAVATSQATSKPVEPKFLEFLNAEKTTTTTTTAAPTTTSSTTTTTTVSTAVNDELKSVLEREEALKKELTSVKNTLAERASNVAPAAAAVIPNKVGNENPESRFFLNTQKGSPQEQHNDMTTKLLGSNGLLSLLNPRIMDQQEAADKLIPSLASNPSVAKFQQVQQGQANQQQPAPRQMPFGNNGQIFPYQPQVPVSPQAALMPQGSIPQMNPAGSFQQPNMNGAFASPFGLNPVVGAGMQQPFGGMQQPLTGISPMNLGGATGFQNPGVLGGMMG